jgi:putative membrane protein
MMGWYHDGIGWGGWLLMTLAMVAFWGLVVVAVIALFRTDSRRDAGTRQTPLELLDERLARGELTTEEYRALRDTLRHVDEPLAPR